MLKYISLIAFLMVGCARTTTMSKPSETPAQFDPAQNMPTVDMKVEPAINEPHIYNGSGWEVRTPQGWKKLEREGSELAIQSEDRAVTATLLKFDFDQDLPTLAIRVGDILVNDGANLATRRTGFINTRSTIQLEFITEGNISQSNLFTTGTEAFVFTCGGKEETFTHNLILCNDILLGLYVGHAP